MTKKDYEAAVKLLIEVHPDPESRKVAAETFAMFFERNNVRGGMFDKKRFLAAALEETGIRGGKKAKAPKRIHSLTLQTK